MGRWTEDAPAPEGMQRIGYDSDTHNYTFRDADGSIYEGGDYGGNLRLVSRPSQLKCNNERIRIFPNPPKSPVDPHAKSPASPTSPTSFEEMLPAHMIVAAPPMAPPTRESSLREASPPASHTRSESGSRRSLWGVVRKVTMSTKMRDVVEAVVRRPSARRESETEGSYARLSNSRESERRSYERHASASSPRPRYSQNSGHAKRPTV